MCIRDSAKAATHWVIGAVPMLLATPLMALMLYMDTSHLPALLLALVLGTAALTGRQNLADWAMLNGLANDDVAIDAALDRMQARAFANLPVRRLSHGQRRRVALARLTLGPSSALWLLDEPNSGLDAASSIALDDLISDHLKGGGMVLAATHLPLGITHSPRTLVLEDMA